MSLINTKIKPFKNQAFKNGEFIESHRKSILEGRWSVFFFYPARLLLSYARPNWVTLLTTTEELQKLGVDVYAVIYPYSLHPQSMAQQLWKPSLKSNMR